MRVINRISDLARPCAFVPTMGALHAGHQSLIHIAKELCDEVVVSVFVNPLQFNNKDDFAKYPSTPERDEELAAQAGATVLWRPSHDEIYPENFERLSAGELGKKFEGHSRPGHFDGVVTVVNQLFNRVQPKFAIFGEKDFQQLALIRTMAESRHPEIEIIAAPTIRESSGLALSSRNVRLNDVGREAAEIISRALRAASDRDSLKDMRIELEKVKSESRFTLDYADIIDEDTFEIATDETARKRALVAGWIDGIRLIDNMAMKRALVRS